MVPPANGLFQLPNVKGEYPDTGVQGDVSKASLTSAQTNMSEDDMDDLDEEGVTSMHNCQSPCTGGAGPRRYDGNE